MNILVVDDTPRLATAIRDLKIQNSFVEYFSYKDDVANTVRLRYKLNHCSWMGSETLPNVIVVNTLACYSDSPEAHEQRVKNVATCLLEIIRMAKRDDALLLLLRDEDKADWSSAVEYVAMQNMDEVFSVEGIDPTDTVMLRKVVDELPRSTFYGKYDSKLEMRKGL